MNPKTAAALVALLSLTGLAAQAMTVPTQIATPSTPPTVAGDFNSDGTVDGNDFLIWHR